MDIEDTDKAHYFPLAAWQPQGESLGPGAVAELEDVIQHLYEAVHAIDGDTLNKAKILSNLGTSLRKRFGETKNMSDLAKAIQVTRSASDMATRIHEASEMTPEDDPDRAGISYNLGLLLEQKFYEDENFAAIEEAIGIMRVGLDVTRDSTSRAACSTRLGELLHIKYKSAREKSVLEEAIRVTHVGLTMTPEGPAQAKPLASLGLYLYKRYRDTTKTMVDLDEAVRVARIAVQVALETDSNKSEYICRLVHFLSTRYSLTETETDLDDSIKYWESAIAMTPPGHPARSGRLGLLAGQLGTKYLKKESMADLDMAIRFSRAAVDEAATTEDQIGRLYELQAHVLRKYLDTDALEDLDELIQVSWALINSPLLNDEDRPRQFRDLANRFTARYGKTGETSDLEEAIRLTRAGLNEPTLSKWEQSELVKQLEVLSRHSVLGIGSTWNLQEVAGRITHAAVAAKSDDTPIKMKIMADFMSHLCDLLMMMNIVRFSGQVVGTIRSALNDVPAHHPARVTISRCLADSLVYLFEQTWEIEHLHEAIKVLKEILTTAPEVAPGGRIGFSESMLNTLRDCLDRRYDETEELADLQDAILVLKSTLHLDASNHQTQSKVFLGLGSYLAEEFQITGVSKCLAEAITFTQKAMETATGQELRQRTLVQLGNLLGTRYNITSAAADLEEAIQLLRTGADGYQKYLQKAPILNNLGQLLGEKYARTDSIADLEDAIRVTREAVDNTVCGAREPTYLDRLGIHLRDLFRMTGLIAHLEEAIRVQRAAVARAARDDPERLEYLASLGWSLYVRYSEVEIESDLDEATWLLQTAVESVSQDSRHKARYLCTLCKCLGERYERTRKKTDLDKAMHVAYAALDAAPAGNQHRAFALRVLGDRLNDRFQLTGILSDILKAIDLTKEAVDITSGRQTHAECLYSLGLHLAEKYRKTAELEDLEESIRLTRMAADVALGAPKKLECLKNIALFLHDKYEKIQTVASLYDAIRAAEAAVAAAPKDHPDCAEVMGTLGTFLEEKYARTNEITDLRRAMEHHQLALQQENAHVLTRIEAGIDILRCCALISDWQQAYKAVLIAVGLVPTLILRSLKNSDKQHILSRAAGLASDAAAAALNAAVEPYESLSLLELGRGLLATSVEEMRADILGLRERHPDLADEFVRLQGELIRTSLPYQADKAFDQLLVDIRNRPGFERFLLAPSKEDIMQTAAIGPIIVVNVSDYGSHAILVERGQIRALPLPNLRSGDVDKRTLGGNLGAPHVLTWLWEVVTRPVLDVLGYTACPSSKDWPRVWWVPIGSLGRFPLHAAGRHDRGLGETVIDRVMSSYSSSVKAIIHGRQRPIRPQAAPSAPPRALLVAMRETPGHTPLYFADDEVKTLRDICKDIPLDFVEPGQHRGDIIAQLPGCTMFHFAGHGFTDGEDPSQSHLLVSDGNITVSDLLEMNFRERSPFLAYLSACGTGRIQDDRFLDESIHLISSFQLAGFRHVIGTLWNVDDECCTKVARVTYEEIRDGGFNDYSVCLGLHNAARDLRRSWLQKGMAGGSRNDKHGTVVAGKEDNRVGSKVEGGGNSTWPRDVFIVEDGEEIADQDSMFWIPYVHFGV
ncbi:CHAT domain-containing protein [Xylariaceae sp. FL0255]|nr:CHAT domain-containing protein [Xylariaceae sp. FL0255]